MRTQCRLLRLATTHRDHSLGTADLNQDVCHAAALAQTTLALGVGVRNFFSSVLAGNQKGFGAAIAATKVARKELFVCGSVNTGNGACSGLAQCKEATADGCSQNMQDTGLSYLDMIMLVRALCAGMQLPSLLASRVASRSA